jgi:SpoVK/Ycf46/Vps4 family AAA+-type ATPase
VHVKQSLNSLIGPLKTYVSMRVTPKKIVDKHMIKPIVDAGNVERVPLDAKRSVLLFGPPGTGKTSFVRAIAEAIGWDFMPINPSVFLEKGLEGIYATANNLFRDLRDLYRTVVFFDEMDAMLQRRIDDEGYQLAVEQQFLTTSMLPHLAELYDAGQVLFFFATNYGGTFDKAVTRPGRFDMLLFVGPPSWSEKLTRIDVIMKVRDLNKVETVRSALQGWIPPTTDSLDQPLSYATIGEIRALFKEICKDSTIDDAIDKESLDRSTFRDAVTRWQQERLFILSDEMLLKQYKAEKDTSEIR